MPGSVKPLELTAVQIPYHFRCPISLELMTDPVTVSTGQTYDRSSIESWIATGNDTCPVTRSPLTDFSLIPNHTLRRLIQEWCVAHRSQGVERIPTPKQPADPSLIRLLLSQASTGDLTARVTALRRIRSLARESDKNRSVISTQETRSALISIAFEELDLRSDLSMDALATLSLMSLTESESLSITMMPERLAYLAEAMTSDSATEVRISAAAVMEAAAAASRSSEIRSAIGSIDGVIETFVWLAEQKESGRGLKVGIRGIFTLCLAKENRKGAIDAGAARVIMRRLGELKEGELERGLAAVELMCRVEGGREAAVGGGGGGKEAVVGLVRAMGKGERAAEHAAGVMVAVVGAAEGLQREAVAAGVVTQLLVMVQSGCSERAKRKAQVLLKMVRSAWPVESQVANSDDYYYFQPY